MSPLAEPGPAPAPDAGSANAPVVAADLEGTCTAGETWRGVGRWLGANGRRGRYRRFLLPRVAALPLVKVGLVERQAFRNRWIRDLARLLEGLGEADVEALAEEVVATELWPRRRAAVVDELARAASDGARIVVATGTYQPVLDAFTTRLGDEIGCLVSGLGTPLEMRDGHATGRLLGPVGTGVVKASRVAAHLQGAALAAAYGDSLADVPLLEAAAEAVAVAPDGQLRPVAVARGWRILDDPAAGG